ncbi:unnamed protein product [Euphydryas editha]|uniref:Uncharacterized protein n=1 Tax=Euphydryas editha TaxID=104508 RepID=A0AAU9TKR1_EUPED|nr:unnamed protein product [Euphydryas editha]
MRRKEVSLPQRGGLIASRTNQQQSRMQGFKSQLPRSYSTPASQNEISSKSSPSKSFVMRSFSSPEPKQSSSRRNPESFYRPDSNGSRSELDSDLENFEQFDECLMDIDADTEEVFNNYQRSPERERPKRVVTTILPGSGLQKILIKPICSNTAQENNIRESSKKLKKEKAENKKTSRLNFRPLIVKMPTQHILQNNSEHCVGVEELQNSPPLELEVLELDKEFDKAEEHLKREAAIAAEESDVESIDELMHVFNAVTALNPRYTLRQI